MPNSPNPIDNPELYQSVQIAGQVSPGYCVLKGWQRKFEWDIKKGKGSKGANITFVQRPPAKGEIVFYLGYFDLNGSGGGDHFTQWQSFRQLLKYDPTKKAPQATDVYHPALAEIDITSVVVEDIGAVEHVGDNLYSITISCLEYFPPPAKNATGSPTGSDANRTKGGDSAPIPATAVKHGGDLSDDLLKQLQQQP